MEKHKAQLLGCNIASNCARNVHHATPSTSTLMTGAPLELAATNNGQIGTTPYTTFMACRRIQIQASHRHPEMWLPLRARCRAPYCNSEQNYWLWVGLSACHLGMGYSDARCIHYL